MYCEANLRYLPPDVLFQKNFDERLKELEEYLPTKVFKTYQTLEAGGCANCNCPCYGDGFLVSWWRPVAELSSGSQVANIIMGDKHSLCGDLLGLVCTFCALT